MIRARTDFNATEIQDQVELKGIFVGEIGSKINGSVIVSIIIRKKNIIVSFGVTNFKS